MEYLGIKLEEEDAWVVSSFGFVLKTMKEEKGLEFSEEQKTLLFVVFYSGILKGKTFADAQKEA
jgi:hypothetical protein